MSDYKFACPSCGQHLMGDVSYAGMQITCPGCQRAMTVPAPPPAAPAVVAGAPSPPPPPPAAARPGTPPSPRPAPPSRGLAPPAAKPKTSGLAVASLVCSCATVVAGPFGAIPGVICGHLARARLKRDPSLGGHGLAKAGLIVGYSLLGVMVVWMGVLAYVVIKGVNQGMRQAMQQPAQPRPVSGQPRGRTGMPIPPSNLQPSAPVDTTPDGRGWTLDLAGAEIPATPAQGRVHGQPFTVERTSLQGGWLKLQQGRDFLADLEFGVVLFENDVNRLAGRTFNMPGQQGVTPHIWVNWKEEGQSMPKQTSFTQQYAMRLEFGEVSGGKLPGKIYLCVPDAEKSFVRGVFEVDTRPSAARPGGGIPRPRQGAGRKSQGTAK